MSLYEKLSKSELRDELERKGIPTHDIPNRETLIQKYKECISQKNPKLRGR